MHLGFVVYINLLCLFLLLLIIIFQKAENKRLKKASWPKFCNIIFLFLLKIGSVGPADQQINLVSPK